jgi:uncharacterized membrane protein YfcA
MKTMEIPQTLSLLGAFAAAFVAGAINSVAGGGTMISFPILIALGLPPLIANATNTLGIWPGAIGSIWGFRPELARVPKAYRWLLVPALIGGALGAVLLRLTSASFFERVVPGLILFATALFIVAPPIRERLRNRRGAGTPATKRGAVGIAGVFGLQIAVSIYGGYFGAGMSILMLSILSIIGMTDMLEMTAMTSLLSLAINGVAGAIFAFSGLIRWPYAAAMAVGAILGGYGAAGIARRVGSLWIRRLVITVGLALAIVMFCRLSRGAETKSDAATDQYLKTRDSSQPKNDAEDQRDLKELEELLRPIIGAVKVAGFAGEGELNLQTLQKDGGFDQLDGLRFDAKDETLFVTTTPLFDDYLRRHPDIADQIYSKIFDWDSSFVLYAEVPLRDTATLDSAHAFLMLNTQDDSVAAPPNTLIVSTSWRGRVEVMRSVLNAIPQIPECKKKWDEFEEKSAQASARYRASGLKDQQAFEDSNRLESEGARAYRACYGREVFNQRYFQTVRKKAQSTLERLVKL